ncbi:MAG: DinB family protein [Bacteroidia bacterium]|nr:DinB family protein [Bacteroidia bacterium]
MSFQEGKYPAYFLRYIDKISNNNLIQGLEENLFELKNFFGSIPPEKENHAYAPGKWTIKEILNHITDTERIFTYRALRFARKDPQQLLAFEEDDYARAAAEDVNKRSMASLIEELEFVRRSSIAMYKHFSSESLNRTGHIPSGEISVKSIGYILCGHVNHHIEVIKEKYL